MILAPDKFVVLDVVLGFFDHVAFLNRLDLLAFRLHFLVLQLLLLFVILVQLLSLKEIKSPVSWSAAPSRGTSKIKLVSHEDTPSPTGTGNDVLNVRTYDQMISKEKEKSRTSTTCVD